MAMAITNGCISVVPPSFFAVTRFIVAGALLLLIWGLRGEVLSIARSDIPRLIAVTLLMVVATYSLLFWGARFLCSGLTAILDLAFMPVAHLSIGAMLGEERFTRARSLGSVLARPLLKTYPSFLLSGFMLLWGGLVLFAGSMALEPGAAQAVSGRWGTPAWGAWVFLVVFGSLLAYRNGHSVASRTWCLDRQGFSQCLGAVEVEAHENPSWPAVMINQAA